MTRMITVLLFITFTTFSSAYYNPTVKAYLPTQVEIDQQLQCVQTHRFEKDFNVMTKGLSVMFWELVQSDSSNMANVSETCQSDLRTLIASAVAGQATALSCKLTVSEMLRCTKS